MKVSKVKQDFSINQCPKLFYYHSINKTEFLFQISRILVMVIYHATHLK